MPQSPTEIRSYTDHRPWQMPDRPWIMAQSWQHLLFAHWQVDPDALRGHIPPPLELDTVDGQAWVGVVPFLMNNVRLRWLPPVPGTARFPELNVRTYVTFGGKPGVWFFSLDAANPLAVTVARLTFHLPYFHADMLIQVAGGTTTYTSQRTHRGAQAATFSATYAPTGAVYYSQPGTLEHWLTERYALYAVDGGGHLCRGEIHHPQWSLQPARADITSETMVAAGGLTLQPGEPLLHYVEQIDVVAWAVERVT